MAIDVSPAARGAVCGSAAICLASSLVLAAAGNDDRRVVDAARGRDASAVRVLLEAGADANLRQPDGATALHWAAHWDDAEMARRLLHAGADVDAAGAYGVTPLSLAAANASVSLVELLLDAGADPNAARDSGETPLMRASATGSVAAVRALLSAGAHVDAADPLGAQTPLMLAASGRHPDVVAVLLARGADVEARSRLGFTPLLFAAREGDLTSARRLVAAGADVDAATPDGTGALLVATVRGQVRVGAVPARGGGRPERGADRRPGVGRAPHRRQRRRPRIPPPRGRTTPRSTGRWVPGRPSSPAPTGSRRSATPSGRRSAALPPTRKRALVDSLLAFGADPNARMRRTPPRFGYSQISYEHNKQGVNVFGGATPLMLAAMAGDAEVMRLLAARGADPALTTDDGTTLLMVAAGLGRYEAENLVTEARTLEAVRAALAFGADVNAVNDVGNTALHAAAHIKSEAIVQLLADRGAAVDVANDRGDTPVIVADRFRAGSGNVTVRTPTGDLLRALGAQDPAPPR